MLTPSAEEGVNSFRRGSLIRKLKPVVVATLNNGVVGPTSTNVSEFVTVRGLSPDLSVHVSCVFDPAEGFDIFPDPTLEPAFPAAPGTMQIWPVTRFPETGRAQLRPIFQDPTLIGTDNANHPLAQNIPYGWEGQTSADELDILIQITSANWNETNYSGRILVQASVAYDGAWQDIKAIEYALSRVQLRDAPSTPLVIATGVT